MKKTALILTIIFSFSAISCSSAKRLKKLAEKTGYTQIEMVNFDTTIIIQGINFDTTFLTEATAADSVFYSSDTLYTTDSSRVIITQRIAAESLHKLIKKTNVKIQIPHREIIIEHSKPVNLITIPEPSFWKKNRVFIIGFFIILLILIILKKIA